MFEVNDTIKEAIIGYYSGDLTKDQADVLLKWIHEDPRHLRYFHEMAEVWNSTSSLSAVQMDNANALGNLRKKITDRDLRPIPSREIRLRLSTIYKLAAAILFLISLGVAALVINIPGLSEVPVAFIETSAPKGSKSLITLSDGTSIWLNADTKLRYSTDYGTKNRNIYLDGEAYFEVAKNRELPFQVHTSGITVTALGTVFNVKAYPEEKIIETTLEEGSVRIDPITHDNSKGAALSIMLKPNQKAVYQKRGHEMSVTGKVLDEIGKNESAKEPTLLPIRMDTSTVQDIRLYTSWKDTRWIFKNEKLGSLAIKLERRYDVNIKFENEALKNYAFSGTLKEESLEQVLSALSFAAPIRYEIKFKEVQLFEDNGNKKAYQKLLSP
jgi:transmembrane sensor